MMVLQDTLERLTTDLMRDREERRRERRVREERNWNGERHEGGMKRVKVREKSNMNQIGNIIQMKRIRMSMRNITEVITKGVKGIGHLGAEV